MQKPTLNAAKQNALSLVLTASLIFLATPPAHAGASRCEALFRSNSVLGSGSQTTLWDARARQPNFMRWSDELTKSMLTVDPAEKASAFWEFNMPVPVVRQLKTVKAPTRTQQNAIQQSVATYQKNFGNDTTESLMWTGVECGNPLTRHEDYRWDSLEEQGLYDPTKRSQIIASLVETGIRNVRIGLSNHRIDLNDDSSWKVFDDIIRDMHKAGLKLSLDLHHFGIEDRFRVTDKNHQTIGEKSYYLNPEWPDYFAKFAQAAVKRYGKSIKAITIMNEPETVAGFNGEMWHGGFPGWNDSRSNSFYIERSIQVAKASVQARLAIESYLTTLPQNERPNFTYMHTEAAVYKAYWEDFNLYRRFLISDLILGSDWVRSADLSWLRGVPMTEIVGRWHRLKSEERTNFDWVIENYIVFNRDPANREDARTRLVELLGALQKRHSVLSKKFGKTMKTNAVFAIDYYAHNEDRGRDGKALSPEPQNYVSEIESGNRAGMYSVLVDYYNHFMMPMMVGETGTPYHHYGARWAQQALLDSSQAAQQGIPFLGLTLYPLVDTYGWESALSAPKGPHVLYNPSGLLRLPSAPDNAPPSEQRDYAPRPFVKVIMNGLRKSMP